MIIDIVIVNVALWSFIAGYRGSIKKGLYKLIALIASLLIALVTYDQIVFFDESKVAATITESDYIISVSEENIYRDYILAKEFVTVLPVTTQMQQQIINEYYKTNREFIEHELIETASITITKTMEFFLVLTITIIFLNIMGFLSMPRRNAGGVYTAIIYLLVNIFIISVMIALINFISIFLLQELPIINFDASVSRALIYKIIDIVIKLI